MSHAEIYNNTIINRSGHAVGYLTDVPGLNFRNNLFIMGSTPIHGPYSASRYVRNLYWCLDNRGFDMDGCCSIQEWSLATGQEKMGERISGLYADPKLIMPDPEAEVLTKPMSPQTLQVCMLQADSPCIGAGIPIPDNGGHDFWGNRIPEGEPTSIGAHERREDAVKALHRIMSDVQSRTKDISPEEIEQEVAEAIREVRKEKHHGKRGAKRI